MSVSPSGAVVEGESPTDLAPVLEPRGVRLATVLGVRDAGRALRDFATYLPTKVIPAIAGFLVLPIVAHKLAPTELGVLYLAQTWVSAGWIVSGQWLTAAITRELPNYRAHNDMGGFARRLLRSYGVTALLFCGFVGVLGITSAISSAVLTNFPLIVAASAGLIAQNLAITIFAAALRPIPYAITEMLARLTGYGLGAYLVFQGHKVEGYLTGIAVASCFFGGIGLLISFPRGRRAPVAADSYDIGSWLRYGFPAGLSNVVTWLLLFSDRYLLAILKSTKAVGLYSLGNSLGDKVITIPILAFLTATRPLLVNAYENKGRDEVERLMRAYTRVVLLIAIPIVAYVAVTRTPILTLAVGSAQKGANYGPVAKLIPIIAVGSLLFVITAIGNTGLVIGRQTVPMVYSAAIGLGVNVAVNVVLIPLYGALGAAIATVISMGAYMAAAQYWSRRLVTWHFPFATLARTLVAAGAGGGVAYAAMRTTDSNLGKLGAAAALGGLAYVLVLVVLREHRTPVSSA
jgi:O-antigen/teichoic acid export membrane protein